MIQFSCDPFRVLMTTRQFSIPVSPKGPVGQPPNLPSHFVSVTLFSASHKLKTHTHLLTYSRFLCFVYFLSSLSVSQVFAHLYLLPSSHPSLSVCSPLSISSPKTGLFFSVYFVSDRDVIEGVCLTTVSTKRPESVSLNVYLACVCVVCVVCLWCVCWVLMT